MKMNFSIKDKTTLEKNYNEAMKNENFANFVNKMKLTKEDILSKVTKIEDTLEELNNCKKCHGLYECKNKLNGNVLMPVKDNGIVYFKYIPCKYLKKEYALKKNKESEEKINETCRMKDIDISDKKRVPVFKYLDNFYDSFDFSKNMKGLYLHGNFGCGKTFMISALLHELNIKKHVNTMVVYYPEILRELKSDWESYEYKMRELKEIDILCLDDIGAEKVTEWSRDEVLGTILQYRMNNNLATFFTSNLNLDELERHFIILESKDEKIKARRIMERIKQLSLDMELISVNRRN